MNTLFSVVIPSFNRAAFIRKAIQSVLNQSYQNFELIIVDDGSTDGTEEIVRPFLSDRIFYKKISNSERGAARNIGIEMSSGDFITFLDSDDVILPNYLLEANKSILQNLEVKFVHFSYEIRDSRGKVLYTRNKLHRNPNQALLEGNYMSCIGCFIKRELLIRVRFNEDRKISGSEDWLLWLQIAAIEKIYQSPIITSYMVNHDRRSVLQFNEKKLLNQMNGVLGVLSNDEKFIAAFGFHAINVIRARYLSYIALHALMSKERILGLKYLVKSLVTNPKEIKYKRTVACFKKLIFN